jgi:hypothetical protein
MWADIITSPFTLRRFAIAVIAATLAVSSCARTRENAKPIATPTATVSRSTAPAGSPLDITYRFVVAPDAPAFTEDYVVFVHVLDDDHVQMWTDDHQPPTPTRLWKAGSTIEYTRSILMPKYPYVGAATIEVGLYAPSSGQRLPLACDDAGMRSYRIASLTLTSEAAPAPVTFAKGWYTAEVGDGGQEWRWSSREATITFKNPKRDSTLYLELEQTVPLAESQRVEVRLGTEPLEAFALPFGMREMRRILLAAPQLGEGETSELTVTVDRTVVPARVPELRSQDARELGVRVFRVYIQPK